MRLRGRKPLPEWTLGELVTCARAGNEAISQLGAPERVYIEVVDAYKPKPSLMFVVVFDTGAHVKLPAMPGREL